MSLATLLTAIIVLVVIGVVEWFLVESGYIPLSPPIKVVIRVVIVLAVAIWLLRVFGLWSGPAFR